MGASVYLLIAGYGGLANRHPGEMPSILAFGRAVATAARSVRMSVQNVIKALGTTNKSD
jgi:hypothetical protein